MSKKHKARYFTFILYPESMPENYVTLLTEIGVAMAISPLHDLDLSEKGGIYKKAHYHVIYVAKNPVTTDAVRRRIQRKLGMSSISYVEIVDNIENIYLYLTHESKSAIEENKVVYDKSDIVEISGFDIDRYVTMDVAEKNEVLDLMLELTLNYGFRNIVEFMEFYHREGKEHGLPKQRFLNDVIKANTGMLRMYFDGNYQTHEKRIARAGKEKNEIE